MRNRPETNHNVYILGAGFSYDAGIPLLKDFLERMMSSAEWLQDEQRNLEADAIGRVFEFRRRAANATYRIRIDVDNIEDLFSLASASEGEQLATDVTTAIAATIDYARHVSPESKCKVTVKELINDGQGGSWQREEETRATYDIYAGVLSGFMCEPSHDARNTIITFNYDTLLEDALSKLKVKYNYGLHYTSTDYQYPETIGDVVSSLQILKPHGSLNWGASTTSNDPIEVYKSYDDIRTRNKSVLIVPPTWRKNFSGHLTKIWAKAVEALNEATRIIIIGFSMPATDTHFKFLLAAGLQNNISLRKLLFVNPGLVDEVEGQRLRSNLFSILREELEAKRIVELRPQSTDAFLLSRQSMGLINREFCSDILEIQFHGKKFLPIYR